MMYFEFGKRSLSSFTNNNNSSENNQSSGNNNNSGDQATTSSTSGSHKRSKHNVTKTIYKPVRYVLTHALKKGDEDDEDSKTAQQQHTSAFRARAPKLAVISKLKSLASSPSSRIKEEKEEYGGGHSSHFTVVSKVTL